jgi:hypothetical protein
MPNTQPPFTTDVKNEWTHTSTPSDVFADFFATLQTDVTSIWSIRLLKNVFAISNKKEVTKNITAGMFVSCDNHISVSYSFKAQSLLLLLLLLCYKPEGRGFDTR